MTHLPEITISEELARALVEMGECRRARYVLFKDDQFVQSVREGMPSPGVCPFCDLVRAIEAKHAGQQGCLT